MNATKIKALRAFNHNNARVYFLPPELFVVYYINCILGHKSILKYVLAKSVTIQASTKSYVDDILVKTSQVPAETLIAHLNRFGLVTKPPEQLDGGTALGLKVLRNGRGELAFTRGAISAGETDPEGVVLNLWKIGGSLPGGWVAARGVQLCEAEGRGRQVG